MKAIVSFAVLAALAFALPAVSFAQSSFSRRLSDQQPTVTKLTTQLKQQVVAELARLLRARYCIPDTGEQAATRIEQKLASGGYETLDDPQAFAEAVLADLRDATKDKHLWFGLAEPTESSPTSPEAAQKERLLTSRRTNHGFARADILEGNVGYLEVRRFQPPDLAGDTMAAAFQFLSNTDALIIDLRNCHGGSPYAMPIFAGYLLSRPTHLFDMQFRGDNYTDHYWTAAWLPGKRLAEVPVYILTSAYTFSGAEGFAYRLQVLKRATIVGETTAGGANAGGLLDVAPFFQVWMPMGRPIDRTTATNWEGTGVVPDIKTSSREALPSAHIEALKSLQSKAPAGDKARLEWALTRAEVRYNPPELTPIDLQLLEGKYEKSRVWMDGGQLRFQRENETPYLLIPITRTIFTTETYEPVRLEFLQQLTKPATKLVFTDEDGTVREFARIP